MKSFLTLQSVDQILSFINGFSPLPKEVAALDEAAGRRLAEGWRVICPVSTVLPWMGMPCGRVTFSARRKLRPLCLNAWETAPWGESRTFLSAKDMPLVF